MGLLRSRFTVLSLVLLIASLGAVGCSGRDDPPAGTDGGLTRDAGNGSGDSGTATDAGGTATDAGGGATDAGTATDAGGTAPDGGGSATDAGPTAACTAQDAHGEGACDGFFGYFWDGGACYGVSGCSCVGADCGAGWSSDTECAAAHAACAPTDCRSPGMSCPAGNSCQACLGADGVVYVCLPTGAVC